jgi:hypothetical protein
MQTHHLGARFSLEIGRHYDELAKYDFDNKTDVNTP